MRHTYIVRIPALEVVREYVHHRGAIKYAMMHKRHTAYVTVLVHKDGVITEQPLVQCTCRACDEGACAVQDPCKRTDCAQYWCRERFA